MASGVLHHLDLENVVNEVFRILKPNGLLIAKEPLGINPILKWYRNKTPNARTHDERPLTTDDLKLLNNKFINKEIKFLGLTSLLSVFFRSKTFRQFLLNLDCKLSNTSLKYYFWYVLGIWEKDENISKNKTK